MILFGLEEFASKRRKAQTDIEDRLRPEVKKAVDLSTNTSGWDQLLSKVSDVYFDAYQDEAGDVPKRGLSLKFREALRETLRKTKVRDENSVERITVWLATAILTEATTQASTDDPEDLFLEWVDMADTSVRHAHHQASGQQRPVGEKFKVGGFEMSGPGDPSVPIELWINCRCTLRPVLASEALVASLVAATEAEKHKSTVVVGLPKADHPVHQIGSEQKHVTLAFLGDHKGDPAPIHEAVKKIASEGQPFDAAVSGHATLGPDKAKVALLEHPDIQAARNRLMDDPVVNQAVNAADSHPHFVPHMTIGYDEADPSETEFSSIPIDRLAVWHGDEQTEYPLGADMTDTVTEKPSEAAPDDPSTAAADTRVPWHGILAPEGIRSGDGRRFKEGSLSTRPLPLPLTWQKSSQDGHGGSVVVATIEKAEMVDGLMRGSGYMLSTVEADEVIGLIGEFGRFGVSVDADDSEFELNEEDETVDFTSARVCGASIVPIPAFAEAWVALGHWDEADQTDPVDPAPAIQDPALVASLEAMRAKVSIFKDLAPGKTEDGPGWLTHPVDTDRLRDYWVRGEGAAKIGWGTPGDFNRCRLNVAEYIKPQYLNGYCANRHYDALGFWPGRPVSAETIPFAADTMDLEDTEPAEAVSLVAGAVIKAPAEFFANPNLAEPTPLTIEDSGHAYGHIATWGECHIGYGEFCQTAPHSNSGYSYFLTGATPLDNGTVVATGPLTIGGGHAGGRLGLRAAVEHYDSTSAAVCDVTVGEDEVGIWFSGRVRPGATDEMVTALLASPLSGDWRAVGTDMELIAALAVNTPGFNVPRVRVAASTQGQVSLVAAGALAPRETDETMDLEDNPQFAYRIAEQVAAILSRKSQMAALAARVNGAS